MVSLPETQTQLPKKMSSVGCPFCGILCDDLEVGLDKDGVKVLKNGCELAVSGFERSVKDGTPLIRGKKVSLEEAVSEATKILRLARLPLYGGLGTEVDGMRAVMSLADRTRGVVDHALSEGQFRNFRVLQSSGWVMTTLTEARNRADLFIIVATDIPKFHPRFYERIVTPAKSLIADDAPPRDIVFLGQGLDSSHLKGPRIGKILSLPCPLDQVGELASALRAILNGVPIHSGRVANVPLKELELLAARIREAKYPVFVWAPAALSFPNADLIVHSISELIKDLNKKGRAAGLSLGGCDGAASAAAVCAWQTGYPLRVSYQNGKPEYDIMRYSLSKMLVNGEGDCLVWVSTFSVDLGPPKTQQPLILIGTPGLKSASPPDVFIPVGTAGVDHKGRIIRCDNVLSIPLHNLGRSNLPSVPDVLYSIEKSL
ncbi:MAG: formylmethanofuran dehydrogenase [Hyphomicrobium sp.]